MLLGMEFVTREIRFYTLFEAVYLKTRSEAVDQLANTLVQTYSSLLGYLASAYTYYRKHTIGMDHAIRLSRAVANIKRSAGDVISIQRRWSRQYDGHRGTFSRRHRTERAPDRQANLR